MTRTDFLPAGDALISEEETRRVVERLRPLISAEDAVVSLRHAREATTRFSNNAIAQAVSQERCTVTLTVAFGQRKGTASVDAIDPDALRSLARRAEEVARLAPPDPEFLPSPGPQEYVPVKAHFGSTAAFSEEDSARFAGRLIAPAARAGLAAAGTVETSCAARAVATSNGLFAYQAETAAEAGCTLTSADSSGWARDTAADVSSLDPEALAERALDLARRSAGPREIRPGRYTTLLMPAASARLAVPLVFGANARLTLEGLTYLSGRVGQKLAGEEITIWSDPQHPEIPYLPFDGEGNPRRRVVWIDRGVFGQMWWDRWTARQNGVDPVPVPGALCMDGTDRGVDDLIAGIERGILVTHFWYVRSVKDDQTLVTGLTRDGTFWIEEGRIRHPVRNLRFNDTCLGMVQRAVALGRPERCVGPETFPSVFPPLVVRDWNFVGVTDF